MLKLRHDALMSVVAILCGAFYAAGAAGQQSEDPAADRAQSKEDVRTASADKGRMAGEELTSQSFVTKAAHSSMAEIELSKLALEKSQTEDVRSFAQRMVQDHQKASTELQSIAKKHGLQVPRELDAKHQKEMEKLKSQSGAAFDSAYSQGMLKDHEKAVELFREASTSRQLHPDLQSFAAKTLPTLQTHRRLAGDLPATGASSQRSRSSSSSRS